MTIGAGMKPNTNMDNRKKSAHAGDDFDERLCNQVDKILNKNLDEKLEEQPFIGVWQEKDKKTPKRK